MKNQAYILLLSLLFFAFQSMAQFPVQRPDIPADPKNAQKKYIAPADEKNLDQFKRPATPAVIVLPSAAYAGSIRVETTRLSSEDKFVSEQRMSADKKEKNCVTANYRMTYNISLVDYLSLRQINDGWLMPASVMDTESFLRGSYNIVNTPRNPVKIYTEAAVKQGNSYENVIDPHSKSMLQNAVNKLKLRPSYTDAADIFYTSTNIYSEEELAVKVNGYYNNKLAGVKSSFGVSFDKQNKKNYLLIDFTQNYFKINSDAITGANIFKTADNNTDITKLVYVSSVTYGRRGILLIESDYSHEDLQAAFNLKASGMVQSGGLSADVNSKKIRNSSKVKAIFYGGSAQDAAAAISVPVSQLEQGFRNYIKNSFQGSGTGNAVPISYVMRYVSDGELCAIKTTFNQEKSSCQAARENYKLKVTLTDIQCINGRDGGGDNPDDYGIQQWVVFRALGKDKRYVSRDINKFPARQNGPVQVPNVPNILISGDEKNQIHVRQANRALQRNRGMINNSLVFNISDTEFNDPNISFKFYTWFKEYSTSTLGGNNDKVLSNSAPTDVKIKEVLEILTCLSELRGNSPFPDTTISPDFKAYHAFGGGFMPLGQLQNTDHMILEGPIRIGNPGEKAAVWVQFELID